MPNDSTTVGMGYNTGAVKYILKGPFTNPVAFFIFGSGLLAILNGLIASPHGILDAALAYYSTKYLPPTTLADIIIPIIVGSVIAGFKWWLATPRR